MRILIIRGGAIGDFVLTLPAVKLLRQRWPEAHIECLGYPGIASLGLNRFYFDAVRAMDHGPLAGFFIPDLILDSALMEYFESFQLVVSYIFDPDHIFRKNLQRCGLRDVEVETGWASPAWEGNPPLLLCRDPRVKTIPAVRHFGLPLRPLGLGEGIASPKLYLTEADQAFADDRVAGNKEKIVAVHPGSGSASKNWPVERWIELALKIRETGGWRLLVTAGEADEEVRGKMRKAFPDDLWLEDSLNLNQMVALYSRVTLFLGHDSGPGHLAAAAGTPCILLFGVTDPAIWAPTGDQVKVLKAEGGLASLEVQKVWDEVLRKMNGLASSLRAP